MVVWLFKVWAYNTGFNVSDQLSVITSDAEGSRKKINSGKQSWYSWHPLLLQSLSLQSFAALGLPQHDFYLFSRNYFATDYFATNLLSLSACVYFSHSLPEAKEVSTCATQSSTTFLFPICPHPLYYQLPFCFGGIGDQPNPCASHTGIDPSHITPSTPLTDWRVRGHSLSFLTFVLRSSFDHICGWHRELRCFVELWKPLIA